MRISISNSGSFNKTDKFLKKMSTNSVYSVLQKYGEIGVAELAAATPVDSGRTSSAWNYLVIIERSNARVQWYNSNENQGFSVAIGLQYGHGTGTGGYVIGRDYINPTMRPIFDKIADQVWNEIVNA